MHILGRLLGTLLATAQFTALAAIAHSHDTPPGADPVRYADRHDVSIPAGSVVSEISRAGGGTLFSAEVDAIVDRFTFDEYDRSVRALSGETAVKVGGLEYLFQTRYSLLPAGQVCWEFVHDNLVALGYDVRYQEYTRSGNLLKNIIATIPGEVTPEQIYVLGAHLDSTSPSPATAPGAEDNGSGSAGVLAAAAALAGERFESTIELILFTGEEQGLWGSSAYVADAISEGRDVRAAVTMDMVSYFNNDYGVLIEGETDWSWLMEVMADAVDTYTTIGRDFSYFSFGSDHVPFQDAGIAAILAIELDWAEYPHYHRTTDVYANLTVDLGVQISRAAVASVAHLAGPLGPPSSVGDVALDIAPQLDVYPNPTSGPVKISLGRIAAAAPVEVFDVGGRLIRRLEGDFSRDAGPLTWDLSEMDGTEARLGTYWVRHGKSATRLVVLR